MPSFIFEKDSLLNTKIRLSSTSEEYEIHTRLPGSSTQLFRLVMDSESRTLLASINRKMFLPNTVSLPGKTQRISKWLKGGTSLDGSYVLCLKFLDPILKQRIHGPASIIHLNGSESPTFLADHPIQSSRQLFLPDKKIILAHWRLHSAEPPHELAVVISPDVDAKNYIEILLAFIYQTENLRARTTPM